ncbi:VirB3 family type IV secretion system protein [Pseudomonas kitaguniensis]|uniref:VirB3 family type IV secretion system protein n=1 Tax=Pseudomonas kitaguniensis TaxID=2607908 RepID=UPI003BA31B84
MAVNEALRQLTSESYNGMSRPAMYWNIPIMPLIGLLMGGLVSGVIGIVLFSWIWGLVFLFPFLVVLIALRIVCVIDGQYLRRVKFGWRRIRSNQKYGRALLLTPSNPNWSAFYGKRFSQQRYVSGGKSPADEVSS